MEPIDSTDYKALLQFLMHDLRRINAMIRDNSHQISKATRGAKIDEPAIRHHASIVFEQSAILSSWLAICDMHIDPARFSKEPKHKASLHGMFFMAQALLKRIADRDHLTVKLIGNGKFNVDAHPVMDIMPYLLLDNAIKYSPASSLIEITLQENFADHHVLVESMGPAIEDKEIVQLGTVGFRGENARRRTEIGTGQGLALLKTICEFHNASVQFSSAKASFELEGIPYSTFKVEIKIPKG